MLKSAELGIRRGCSCLGKSISLEWDRKKDQDEGGRKAHISIHGTRQPSVAGAGGSHTPILRTYRNRSARSRGLSVYTSHFKHFQIHERRENVLVPPNCPVVEATESCTMSL